MANVQVSFLTNSVWGFENSISTTERCALTFRESEEGAGDNSVGYITINGEKYDFGPDIAALVFRTYSQVLLKLVKNSTNFTLVYVKTTDVMYGVVTLNNEGEGWYLGVSDENNNITWSKLTNPKIFVGLKQAYAQSESVGNSCYHRLYECGYRIFSVAYRGWKFHAQCNYFGDGSTTKRFNINYLSNYDKTDRTSIAAPISYGAGILAMSIALFGSSGIYFKTTDYLYTSQGFTDGEGWYTQDDNTWTKHSTPPSIIITGGTDANDLDFKMWLTANADSVELVIYDLLEPAFYPGTHPLTIRARAIIDEEEKQSGPSNEVNYVVDGYSVTYNITNGELETLNGYSLPHNLSSDDDLYLLLKPNNGYYISSAGISVSNADYDVEVIDYDIDPDHAGELALRIYNATGNVTINVTYASKLNATRYSVNASGTNCTVSAPQYIYENEIDYFDVNYDFEIYEEPYESSNVSVTNASIGASTYGGEGTKYFILSNPTGNVTITVECTELEPEEPEPEEEEEEEE